MVFAEIKSLEPQNALISAIKISDLSQNPFFEKIWPHSVHEAKLINSGLRQER